MILSIAYREFRSLFLSPLAWSILAIIQFILAYLFLTQVETFTAIQAQLSAIDSAPGLTDVIVTPLYGNAAIILMLVTPLLTMRLICEERRNKTLALLLSAPVSNSDIVIGKYLGILGLLLIMTGLITLMPLSLLAGGTLDFGKFPGPDIVIGGFYRNRPIHVLQSRPPHHRGDGNIRPAAAVVDPGLVSGLKGS